jgi:hypothetical protein
MKLEALSIDVFRSLITTTTANSRLFDVQHLYMTTFATNSMLIVSYCQQMYQHIVNYRDSRRMIEQHVVLA